MLSQFTPYTCVLDCFSSYLRERGLSVFSQDILTNHRDICFNPPPDLGTFGAIDANRFKILVSRYFLIADELSVDDETNVSSAISEGHGLFVFCSRYDARDNLNHTVRIVGVCGNEYEIDVPAFPHGERKLTLPNTIKVDWLGVCLRVSPL